MHNSTLTCCVCAEPMDRRRDSKPQGEAAHNKCRTSTVVTHGEAGYNRGCRCGVCRMAKTERNRRYAASRKARGMPPHNSTAWRREARGVGSVECLLCKEPLQYVRTEAVRYPLHKMCRNNAPEWVRRGLDNPRPAQFQAKIDKAAAGTSGSRVFTCGGCAWCDTYFVGVGRFCSRKCSTSAKYASRSQNSFKISPKERLKIYVRDNWTCQLCDHPVNSDLHYLDDWSATLDHIIPQSHMLVPDHSPSNLQVADR